MVTVISYFSAQCTANLSCFKLHHLLPLLVGYIWHAYDITDAFTNRFTQSCKPMCQTKWLTAEVFILLRFPPFRRWFIIVVIVFLLFFIGISNFTQVQLCSCECIASLSGDVQPRLLYPPLCVLLREAWAHYESHPGHKISTCRQPNADKICKWLVDCFTYLPKKKKRQSFDDKIWIFTSHLAGGQKKVISYLVTFNQLLESFNQRYPLSVQTSTLIMSPRERHCSVADLMLERASVKQTRLSLQGSVDYYVIKHCFVMEG